MRSFESRPISTGSRSATRSSPSTPRLTVRDGSGDVRGGEEHRRLTNLHELYLTANKFTGTIPLELASLPNLEVLDLTYNPSPQGQIPPALLRMPSLRRLLLPVPLTVNH